MKLHPIIEKIFFVLLIIYTTSAQSQTNPPSLARQYEEIVGKAGSYQGYKQVRETRLQALWKSSMDSLQKERQLLQEARAKSGSNKDVLGGLKAELAEKENNLQQAIARKDEVTVMGLSLSENTYHLFVWGLIALFASALIFLIYRNIAANKEARYRSDLYTELVEEYREHKVKSNEKEKKLARELQTERNLVADLTGR